ncbi:hypothetical protein BG015_010796, partial [Linnemannia schmuckeri]
MHRHNIVRSHVEKQKRPLYLLFVNKNGNYSWVEKDGNLTPRSTDSTNFSQQANSSGCVRGKREAKEGGATNKEATPKRIKIPAVKSTFPKHQFESITSQTFIPMTESRRPQEGDPPTPPPPSYASKAANTNSITSPKLISVFNDPTDGHLAKIAPQHKGARVELVNPKAIAYMAPSTTPVGDFLDAVFTTHKTLIEASKLTMPIISINAFNCPDKQRRIEVVYHERLDAATLSTKPITFKGIPHHPLSSNMDYIITKLIFSNYQFQSSQDTGDLLYQRVIDFIQTKKKMGKVIRIEIPTFPSSKAIFAPTHLFYVYVKGVYTPEDVSMERTLMIPHHQKAPVRIQWAGSSPFCNYCRQDGHILNRCPSRLSLICYKCKAAGHITYQCSRFSERDNKASKGKEPVRDLSADKSSSSSNPSVPLPPSSSSPQSTAPEATSLSSEDSEVVPETIPSSPVPNTPSGMDVDQVPTPSFNFTPEITNLKFTPTPTAPSHSTPSPPSSTNEELPPVTASQAAAIAALDVDVASAQTPNKPNKRQVDEMSTSSAQSVRSARSAFSIRSTRSTKSLK